MGLYRLKEKLCIRSATYHHLQRFFLQVRVGVPRSVADEGDDDEVDAVEHQLPHHEVHLDFLHAAVLELLAEFLAEVAPGSNCIKIGNPGKLSIREKVLGKSYSLENSLRESVFREDLFLYNSSLRADVGVEAPEAVDEVAVDVVGRPLLTRKRGQHDATVVI